MKGRLFGDSVARKPRIVSIHAPVKGRLPQGASFDDVLEVSIHAPVKGRRANIRDVQAEIRVSIHAPVKGRHKKNRQRSRLPVFQSTPR